MPDSANDGDRRDADRDGCAHGCRKVLLLASLIGVLLGWQCHVSRNRVEVEVVVYPKDCVVAVSDSGRLNVGRLRFNAQDGPVTVLVSDSTSPAAVEVEVGAREAFFSHLPWLISVTGPGVATKDGGDLVIWRFPGPNVWGYMAAGATSGEVVWVQSGETARIQAYGREFEVRSPPGVVLLFDRIDGMHGWEWGATELHAEWLSSTARFEDGDKTETDGVTSFALRIDSEGSREGAADRSVELSGTQSAGSPAVRVRCLFREGL